ncbi:MFS transporter [Tepidamorphus sp. 3E244]|uniref:MFS transporter n=1 Tax=Tepidamorphus sp. 3E244 TaxID=3385498 RepID=UPI0038FC959C
MTASDTRQYVYEMLTGEDDGRVCRDIPDAACNHQPRNFLTHIASLGATKTSDGLVDPKLVLSWLLGTLGAPAYMVGLLVPIREAGALLPQLFIAGGIRALPRRKWVWAGGSLVQGISVAGMAASALLLDGATAGGVIVALLAVFALARSACSVSYKDVLGKTVSKSTRGTATGTAGSIAAAIVFAFGVLLATGLIPLSVPAICIALAIASACWIAAALIFSTLREEPGATAGGGNAASVALAQVSLLWREPQLAWFVTARGLLIATALAPPFLVTASGQDNDNALGQLGPFVIASSLAAVVSGYVWGRISDRSSRKVLALSATAGAAVLALATVLGVFSPAVLAQPYVAPALLFALMIAYQGVRLGRSTHLVDMATQETRAAYTAVSNSAIGALLLVGSVFGVIAHMFGETVVLGLFAAMCGAAILAALRLEEVQETT